MLEPKKELMKYRLDMARERLHSAKILLKDAENVNYKKGIWGRNHRIGDAMI